MNLFDKKPALGSDVFVAPSAAVIGDVKLGSKSSVFYGSVLRGKEEVLEGLGCSQVVGRKVHRTAL
jgi:carbonic anhydrase/acetyltransferase-like protein (isoleucine patch superfamily)